MGNQLANNKTGMLLILVAEVLKAHFTKDELAVLTTRGVSISGILNSGTYDMVQRADGQKTSLSLMSRWPFDDADDLAIAIVNDSQDDFCLRSSLGTSDSDPVLKAITGTAISSVLSSADAIVSALKGSDRDNRVGYDLIEDRNVNGSDVPSSPEDFEPAITFADDERWATFYNNHIKY